MTDETILPPSDTPPRGEGLGEVIPKIAENNPATTVPEPVPAQAATPTPSPVSPLPPLTPISDLKSRADTARVQKRAKNLEKILLLVTAKQKITNQNVRRPLAGSQSTASAYLTELVKSGRLIRQNRARASYYSSTMLP